MRDLVHHIDRALSDGRRIAVARVVGVDGSGPRDPGAALILTEDGQVFGSVSGGCVESDVVNECAEVLAGGAPRLTSYGIADELAATVGLTCGGTVHIFVELLDWGLLWDVFRESLVAEEPVALVTMIEGPALGTRMLVGTGRAAVGSFDDRRLDDAIERDAPGHTDSGHYGTRHYGPHGEARLEEVAVFIEPFAPASQMIIFGGVDFTAALAATAKVLGYYVTVCDARAVFATAARFPAADQVVVSWPDRYLRQALPRPLTARDAICVLTHDPKFDVPAIVAALETDVGYIGVMGSRRTTTERNIRLREVGVDEAGLRRVHGPLGLDLGARTPEETAISICAEIIRLRAGGSGGSLRDLHTPIHAETRGRSQESMTCLHQP